ncbi:MAG: gamma subclass chorismate mutase AroQ [Burkholderiaceae bacterium]|nr:gamma subclass chorismate mutase AroQ [Burkholderiaceae bacterium]
MSLSCRQRAHAWLSVCLIATALALLACGTSSAAAADQPALKQLLLLIDQRLAVAPLVARAKWNSGAPIDDPAREKAILDAVSQQATEAGVDAAFARKFFQAQFDAGKLIQQDLHAQWRLAKQPPFADVPDLGRDVRPVLDRLTPQIIAALHAAYPALGQAGTDEFIQTQGRELVRGDADGAARQLALQALLGRAN